MIKALIFDFDGLILDTETPEVLVWQSIYNEYGFDLPVEEWEKTVGGYSISNFDPAHNLSVLSQGGLDPVSLKARYRLEADAIIHANAIMPGILDMIHNAKSQGLKVAIGSSSPHAWVDTHAQRLDIYHHFDHIICQDTPIQTRDQLGELAESFNEMMASIESLLRQAEEKRRLEEELRIAREIQMSLLPRGPLVMPGLTLTALCIPAREVGGDYYDFFPLGDRRLGVLIADVAGKGTSAALYMAELKGVVLSLAKIYQSPRQLLIEVNRIISDNLDSRSFITMTYAVVDLERHSVTYARAGHTPLIHCSARDGGRARVLIPDGLVLGLRIDGVEEKFAQLLEECTLPLHPGDVLVLYTDGISEAMDPDGHLFGDARLQQLVEQHAHLPSDQLRERILREVQAFVGAADQHDDMTMILLKVEDMVADKVSAAA